VFHDLDKEKNKFLIRGRPANKPKSAPAKTLKK
jgi:hypothetical protein